MTRRRLRRLSALDRVLGWLALFMGFEVTAGLGAGPQAGEVDPSFAPPSLNDSNLVTQLLVQDDGRVLVGRVKFEDDTPFRRLVRLLPDGASDNSFAAPLVEPQASQEGVLLALQGDRIIIGGEISAVNGVRVDGVARLNSDGSLDGTFEVRHAFGEFVWIQNLVVGVGDEIYLSGVFSGVAGDSQFKVVKLAADGRIDGGFQPLINQNGTTMLPAILAEPEGTLLVGGEMVAFGKGFRAGLIRLGSDGALVRDFRGSFPFDMLPTALALQSDGARLMAGYQLGAHLVRFSFEGRVDPNFDVGRGPSADIYRLEAIEDGRILARGGFFEWNNEPRHTLALVLPDGRLDPAFRPRLGTRTLVRACAAQGRNRVLVGGRVYGMDDSFLGSVVALHAPALTTGKPEVVSGPDPAEVEEGGNLFLRIEARGFPRVAQWFRDGVPVVGATNETYIRFGVNRADAGMYQLRLSNDSGSVSTVPVRITVLERAPGTNLIPNPGFEVLDPGAGAGSLDPYPALSWKGESFPSLWMYPERVPLNPNGNEDVVQGTNYACVYGVVLAAGGEPRLVQQAGLEARLTASVEPKAGYEFTGWFSRADASMTADPGVEISLRSKAGRELILGTVISTNSQGWTRFRTTFVPAVGYDWIRLTGTRSVAGGDGFSGVFLDQLTLSQSNLAPPRLVPIPLIQLPPWAAMVVTNVVEPGTDVEVREDPLRFRLEGEVPAGSSVDAVTGVLWWFPQARDAGAIRNFAVTAGDPSGLGPVARNSIVVQVQEGVVLELGEAWGNASLRPLMPVSVAFFARVDQFLTEIQADLQVPGETFLEPRLESLDPLVEQAELKPLGTLNYRLSLRLRAPGITRGTFRLGYLGLGSGRSGETSVETVRVTRLSALGAGASPVQATRSVDGVIRIVNAAPMLEMVMRSGAPVLRLYGRSGVGYRIERALGPGSAGGWNTVREVIAGSFPTEVPGVDGAGPAGVYRAVTIP